ncbi:MAG: dihydropteroate synthase [Paracoccus sp. (in: a-proteobacteria)]|nr:dihydropteroate synthase [Paracoccus sp. (in: a-proteobacteria)]
MIYVRAIPEESGHLPIAGGWLRFSRVELLERGAPPRIAPASEAPHEAIEAICAPRPPVAGLDLSAPRVMAIINATPDSFSDGGLRGDGIAHGRAQIAAGADLLDLGGESTRPGAEELPADEELRRITPALDALAPEALLSVDTRKAAVARAALKAGARMINDVSGFDFDPEMAGVVAASGAPVCLMHAQGTPETMQDDPRYDDVLLDVYDALAGRIARAEAAGISRARIVIDPGIGFGKTEAHNLAIIRRLSLFHSLGCALLLGVSRKRFIGRIGGEADPLRRGAGTVAVTLAGAAQGAQIHRVHDAGEIVQALRLWRAVTEKAEEEGR